MPQIYDRIEELCKENGITVTTLCSECAIPRASLSDYKNGRTKTLSADTLAKIAKHFGVSVDYLYYGTQAKADDTEFKVALFGGDGNVTPEMWEEVRRYAHYVKEQMDENK